MNWVKNLAPPKSTCDKLWSDSPKVPLCSKKYQYTLAFWVPLEFSEIYVCTDEGLLKILPVCLCTHTECICFWALPEYMNKAYFRWKQAASIVKLHQIYITETWIRLCWSLYWSHQCKVFRSKVSSPHH